MPFETPTPATPWIRGASPLEAIVPAASLGQRIAESNQRAAFEYLSMQAQQARFAQQMQMEQSRLEAQQSMEQMKLDASRQIHQENALREDQKLQIENAYHQNVLGLQKQKLELTQTAAANKFAAQQQFISDREQIKNGLIYEEGVDPEEAERRATVQSLFKNGPLMGVSPAALAQLAKSSSEKDDAYIKTLEDGSQVIVQPSKTWTPWKHPTKEHVIPEPKFHGQPRGPGKPWKITGVSGVTADQLGQLGITNKYDFKPKAGTNAPTASAPKFGMPQKGDVIGGHEFTGGDPAAPSNWRVLKLQDDEEEAVTED